MAEMGGNAPVYRLLPQIENYPQATVKFGFIMHPARVKAGHRWRRWTGEAGQGARTLCTLLSAHIRLLQAIVVSGYCIF